MKICIIGAGPSGLMCAVEASKNKNNEVIVLDANDKVGKKLYITGKGRCNVCNNTTPQDFLDNVVNNSKFLISAINNFTPQDSINFFETNGTSLKTERGNRVFPKSDKASDISKTFLKVLNQNNVTIKLSSSVQSIKKVDDIFQVKTNNSTIECHAVVIATGGASYTSTGSKGDGYKFAKSLGHNVSKIVPALVPIKLKDYNKELAGLSLKNVSATISTNGKSFTQFGEMLFTHTGVSGPIILTLSSYVNKFDLNNAILSIDLKPALTDKTLDDRLIRDFANFKTKIVKNYLKELLPSGLIDIFLQKSNLNPNKEVCNITKEERKQIIATLKNFEFKIKCLEELEFAIVTSGGVLTKEVSPKNMQSKIVPNLFFVGEVLDLDALTGGYNIQIALSTGYCAGKYLKELGEN